MWDGKHECPHCGALYEVTYTKFPSRDKDSADCFVCGKEMTTWNSSRCPNFSLVRRPEEGTSD